MAITIYTKNDCRPCKESKKRLKESGIPFKEINLDEHPEFFDYVKYELGFSSTPVIVTDDGVWSGYRPDKIKAIKQQLAYCSELFLLTIKKVYANIQVVINRKGKI